MYRVVIVDDEELIRDGLKTFVNWNELGFEVAGEAADGNKAFELIREVKPHVVLADIKMPLCTGIELMKKINDAGINTRIIILSGYDEFEYARAALENGAVDYLLKPIKFNKLKEVFTKLKEEYDLKIQQGIIKNKAMQLLKSELLQKIVKGSISGNRKDILAEAEGMALNVKLRYYITFIVEIDDYDDLLRQSSSQAAELGVFSIKNISEEICSRYGEGYAFDGDKSEIIIIFGTDSNDEELINSMVYELKNSLGSVLDFSVTISVGDIFNDILLMNLSYKECRRRADQKFILGKNRIIFSRDADETLQVIENEESVEGKLLIHLHNLDMPEINVLVDKCFLMRDGRNLALDKFFTIISIVTKFLGKNDLCLADYIDESTIEYDRVIKKETMEDIVILLKDILSRVVEGLKKNNFKSSSSVISEVKEYVNRNPGEDITLELIAGKVYMHPMYLSKIFKKETGINFIDYLTNVRIQMAKQLLGDLNLKTYEVSEKVGYKSPKHFSRVFKAVTGVTPKEYRKNLLGYDE